MRAFTTVFFLALLSLTTIAIATDEAEKPSDQDDAPVDPNIFPQGDSRRCHASSGKGRAKRFEVLPGIGWDNLRNVETGQVVDFTYDKCRTTDDGRYIVPDSIFTIPIKSSYIQTSSDYFDSWHSWSSTTAYSINYLSGVSALLSRVSGLFSKDYLEMKRKQIEFKAASTRIQMKYLRYKAKVQPDPRLHPVFKERLLNIASKLAQNCSKGANYEAQLLIRDFGTHVITSMTAGAGLEKTDFLLKESIKSTVGEKKAVLAAATSSFARFFGISNVGYFNSDTDTTNYEKCLAYSTVTSHGGPIMRAFNMTANDWAENLDYELVGMDRAGDPLYFLVTTGTLPELPPGLVDRVEKAVRKATELYYEMNTIRGCTSMDSPNFSFSANFDDSSCDKKATNLTFGGVYQQCRVCGEYLDKNPCDGLEQINPKTNDYSCPDGYTPVLINSGTKVGEPEYKTDCERCGFLHLHKCCHSVRFVAEASYSAYWCAALGSVKPQSGYLFGGIYSDDQDNMVTNAKECPSNFFPLSILQGIQVCLSDDYELGSGFAVPFGGFSTCCMGNPLAVGTHTALLSKSSQKPNSLMAYMATGNGKPENWPKRCPDGYSQHIVTVDDGCEINYCAKSGSMDGPDIPPVKRPPFCNRPRTAGTTEEFVMFDEDSKEWIKDEVRIQEKLAENSTVTPRKAANKGTGASDDDDDSSSAISPAAAVGISIGGTVAVLALVGMMIFGVKKMRGPRYSEPSRLAESDFNDPRGYGTASTAPSMLMSSS